MKRRQSEGFTAIELLITLFIGAVFLFAGYQLYIQVIRDGKEADLMAKLSNHAYRKMREAAAQASAADPLGCDPSSVVSNSTWTTTYPETGSVTFVKNVSCPLGTSTTADLFLIKMTAYPTNDPTKKVEHATYTN